MVRGILAAVAAASVTMAVAPAVWAQVRETKADWLRMPSQDDIFNVWPAAAMEKGINGLAIISCQVSAQGVVFGCKIDEETPPGMGFGHAAIGLAPQFLMKPATRDGKPVASDVRIPVKFTGLDGPGTGPWSNAWEAGLNRKIIPNMAWREAPAYADVAAAYPKKARTTGNGGRATLRCNIQEDGHLNACNVMVEEPAGQGFAAAAQTLVPKFLALTQYSDGTTTKGSLVQVPFVFTPEMLDPSKRLIGRPLWAALPTGDAMLAGYPKAAIEKDVKQGRVVMHCTAAAGGALQSCDVQTEEPAGLGFGAAALELSKTFRIRPWTAEGLPTVGGEISVPIRYVLPDDEPAPVKR